MTPGHDEQPRYACTACGVQWSYREIRYLARCRLCGGALVRAAAGTEPEPPRPRGQASAARASSIVG